MRRIVTVRSKLVNKCLTFAKAFQMAQKDDRDFATSSRDYLDRLGDCAQGKIGEVAICEILKSLGYRVSVSWEVWIGSLRDDGGSDLSLNGDPLLVDVKTIRGYGSWLLVETRKASNLDQIYCLIRAKLPSDIEKHPESIRGDVECEFVGFTTLRGFYSPDTRRPYFRFFQGDRLFSLGFMKYLGFMTENHAVRIPTMLDRAVSSYGRNIYIDTRMKSHDQVGLPEIFLNKDIHKMMDLCIRGGLRWI
jgi:hypothetical protein